MSRITPNEFVQLPEEPASNPVTIFFITGNPGLIGYYHSFLSLLASRLGARVSDTRFQIYGCSLAGFELPGSGSGPDKAHGHDQDGEKEAREQEKEQKEGYHDVESQITFLQNRLDGFLKSQGPQKHKHRVILMGHSVGAYLAMEVLRRHRERAQGQGPKTEDFDIIGGVMLFPTVVDIAKSKSGRKLSMLLLLIPQLALVVSLLARLLTALLSERLLRALIAMFMRISPASQPESTVLDTTCAFLKSKRGVRQAIHLGASEMKTITNDKWTDDIWGIPRVQEPLAKLFFYFGRNDHWVADRTRDDILAARAWRPRGPTMVVCQDGLPHAFCLRHNGTMARKTADMVQAIIQT